jgi:hypothetical protein
VGLQCVRLGVDTHLRLMTRSQTLSLPTAVKEDKGQVCLSVCLSLVQHLDPHIIVARVSYLNTYCSVLYSLRSSVIGTVDIQLQYNKTSVGASV